MLLFDPKAVEADSQGAPTMNSTDTTTANLVTDPICGMEIDPATAAGSSVYQGTTIYFCSTSCKSEFDTGHGNP
jgi:Cu+-exporting ATPase